MKFKRLPQQELEKLEKEFVQFLASNTITAEDWQKLKEEDVERASQLIDMFSDIVYKKVLEKVEYLEFRTPNDMKLFKCGKEQINMLGMEVDRTLEIDLRKNENIKTLMDKPEMLEGRIQVYKGDKKYNGEREPEIFEMMEKGALKTDATLFNLLSTLHSSMKK